MILEWAQAHDASIAEEVHVPPAEHALHQMTTEEIQVMYTKHICACIVSTIEVASIQMRLQCFELLNSLVKEVLPLVDLRYFIIYCDIAQHKPVNLFIISFTNSFFNGHSAFCTLIRRCRHVIFAQTKISFLRHSLSRSKRQASESIPEVNHII